MRNTAKDGVSTNIGVLTPSRRLLSWESRPDLRGNDTQALEPRRPLGHASPWICCLPRSASSSFLFSGSVNRHQHAVVDYLLEENRVLRAAHGPRRLCLTDDQRRRLAVEGKVLGQRHLADIAGIVTPDTILRWYRRLVAKKLSRSGGSTRHYAVDQE